MASSQQSRAVLRQSPEPTKYTIYGVPCFIQRHRRRPTLCINSLAGAVPMHAQSVEFRAKLRTGWKVAVDKSRMKSGDRIVTPFFAALVFFKMNLAVATQKRIDRAIRSTTSEFLALHRFPFHSSGGFERVLCTW